jgi:hypothetical protein
LKKERQHNFKPVNVQQKQQINGFKEIVTPEYRQNMTKIDRNDFRITSDVSDKLHDLKALDKLGGVEGKFSYPRCLEIESKKLIFF